MSSLGREALASIQLERLRTLLTETLANNLFYSAKLRAAGVSAELDGLEDFSARVPFTLKQELVDDQRQNPPYGSNLTYPLTDYCRFHKTSGSASTPIRWLDTPESWSWMLDCWDLIFEAAGVHDEDRLFFPFSFGPFLGFWTAFEAATRAGRLTIPSGGVRTVGRLRMILENEATVVCATPTYAIRMGETALEENIDTRGLSHDVAPRAAPALVSKISCADLHRGVPWGGRSFRVVRADGARGTQSLVQQL